MSRKRTVNRGTTFPIYYQHQHDGVDETLVGATVFFTVKDIEWDTDATDTGTNVVISKTVTSHTNAAAGQTTIELTPTDTYVAPAEYYYDLKVKESNGKIYKVDEGILVIDGSPTNRTA